MGRKKFLAAMLIVSACIYCTAENPQSAKNSEQDTSYGNAQVQQVLEIDGVYSFRCDIADWPDVIGQDIPVRINGIEPPAIVASEKNPNIFFELQAKRLLEEILSSADSISIENIQRGQNFCLIADVIADSNSIADILVEKGFAQKKTDAKILAGLNTPGAALYQSNTLRSPYAQLQSTTALTATPQTPVNLATGYVASKSSRVFHRSNCSHVKRLSAENIVRFKSRDEAIKTGRRPCKTCNP